MDYKIYFCADGILRAQYSEKEPMIPISFLQKESEASDLKFWANWWDNQVFFEDGLTVGKFLICLEPWTEFWSDITSKNIEAYIKEVRKPISLKNSKNKNSEELAEEGKEKWVGIFYMTNIRPETEYSPKDNNAFEEDIEKWFNTAKDKRLKGTWEVESHYRVSSYNKGEEEHYSIDYTPMNELANVPIYILPEYYVEFSEWESKKILGKTKGEILKKNAFGVNKLTKGKHTLEFLQSSKYHKMREVVEGFFYWMFTNPTSRDAMVADLIDRKDELEEFLEAEKAEKSNVIAFSKSESQEDVEEVETKNGEKKLTVKVAPNAFSPMIQHYEMEKQYWKAMLLLANKEKNVILKIGKTQEAKAPEKRLYGHIVPIDDINANPQPSKYKKY